jgi:hypothetical protein
MPEQAFTLTVNPAEAPQLEMLQHVFSPGTLTKPHAMRYEVQKLRTGHLYEQIPRRDVPMRNGPRGDWGAEGVGVTLAAMLRHPGGFL